MEQIAKMIANTIEFSKSLPKDYKRYETYCKECGELIGTPFIARVKDLKKCKTGKSKITDIHKFIQSKLCWDCYNKKVKK